jgi:predicted DNA-binding transcriptional regulator AlpA
MTATDPSTPVDLRDPIYLIEHLAALFHVSVDTAREYTSRTDFPGSRQLGVRLMWDREEVLDWFRSLPARSAEARRRTQPTAVSAPAPASRTATYRPRRKVGQVAA